MIVGSVPKEAAREEASESGLVKGLNRPYMWHCLDVICPFDTEPAVHPDKPVLIYVL